MTMKPKKKKQYAIDEYYLGSGVWPRIIAPLDSPLTEIDLHRNASL